MASPHSDRSDIFPKIQKQGLVESKTPQLTYIEDSSFDIRELARETGNERQFFRNSPPTIVGYRKPGSQNSSRNNSPVQRRFEQGEQSISVGRSPSISLDLGASFDDVQLLRDRISRLTQDKEQLNTQLAHYRKSSETAQTDLAAEKVITTTLQNEQRDMQQQLSEKEQKIMELKCEIEGEKQNEARLQALVTSLRQRVREAEDDAEDRENIASRSDVTILSLRKEMQNLQDKLQQAEVSLRHHIGVEEEASKRASKWENKCSELRHHLVKALHLDATEAATIATESLISKIADLIKDRHTLIDKSNSLTRNVHESNMEAKASRETIMRLVSEVGQEKKASNEYKQQLDQTIRERDTLQQKVREMDIQNEQLKRQVTSSQDAWSDVNKSLEEREAKIKAMEEALQTSEYTGQATQHKLHGFKRHLAQLVTPPGEDVTEDEQSILTRVNELVKKYKDFRSTSESVSVQVKNLADELDSQRSLHRTTLKRATQAENQLKESHERVSGLEGELLSSDVERDSLKEDKRKFVAFCEKLAGTMKLDEIASDVGFDVNGEALLARAGQLVKLETDALDDRKTTIYNLQRRLKWAKQQIESKDLHQGLLKKKVDSLEEILRDKSRVEVERDENSIRFKKLVKHNDKLQRELLEYKQEVTHLKAKLLDVSELKTRTIEQERTIENLEQVLNKLAKSKQKTKEYLVDVKTELEASQSEARETMAKTSGSLSQVTSELNTTKIALEESRLRERQLLDFRQVLARLLGLDVNNLSVPDYEIIARLERLVQAHHAHSITTHSLEGSLQDMEHGFRNGYEDAIAILRAPSPLKVSSS
ncbi:coiled-coil domain-containing protein 170-like [Actinia tenebrosa]|uniref:Coiled-coil domain-containing protein 170-like n=1 Tax=Actinia tenebrosa TaxID=6105 RepID=A0A6P8HI49_ACTTE|nr:coiled-coil domain-containing protein 170-like [Actinia tenebrosa]